ncbi:galectin-1-like [Osmerus eperlanus]|uniref:galectin-1-like n=1 Tax=Osmerus eperlanus TaxID=29151 RepID=UPI002E14D738
MNLVLTDQQVAVGEVVEVKGKIPADAKKFAISLGSDISNIALEVAFYWNDPKVGTMVLFTSTVDPVGTRIPNPLAQTSDVMISIILKDKKSFTVSFLDKVIPIINNQNMVIQYINVMGDFALKSLKV